jgi:hypothetical protein
MFLKILKYGLYGVGISLVFTSFLFFGRSMGTYNNLLIIGLLCAIIGFAIILTSIATRKNKFRFVGLTLLLVLLQFISEPYLIQTSYKIYLTSHRAALDEMVNILSKSEDTFWIIDEHPDCDLIPSEIDRLTPLKNKANISAISVSDDQIYFELWGRLDIRHGMSYFHNKTVAQTLGYKNIEGNWFH